MAAQAADGAAAEGRRPRVVLGVSGGIAAYKACELLRRLTESGHEVTVVPTEAALHAKETIEAAIRAEQQALDQVRKGGGR